jgi:hypothetical protein
MLQNVTWDLGLGHTCWNDERLRKMDMKFGTWNVGILYRAGSLVTVSSELTKSILDLVAVQEVRLDRDGLRNVGFLTAQPFALADSLRELHHTQSPGKQQIS